MGKEFRILALDGGGILGIYSAAFLERIEEKYGKKLTDHVDLIAGTSAGSITGAGLATGYTAGQMREFYQTKGPWIFRKNIGGSLMDHLRQIKQVFFSSKYTNKRLLSAFKHMYGTVPFRDSNSYLCFSTFNVTKGVSRVFKTPHGKHPVADADIPIWQAVACSAAPPTFLPEYFPGLPGEDNDGYVDGGTWAQNPSLMGLVESYKYFVGPGKKYSDVKILSVASFSEDLKRNGKLKSVRDWGWGLDFMGLFMTATASSDEYLIGKLMKHAGHNYLRVDPGVTQEQAKKYTPDNVAPEILQYMIDQGYNKAEEFYNNPVKKAFLDDIFSTPKDKPVF
jgi:patatin-like phospholipase/acyl hydrolase